MKVKIKMEKRAIVRTMAWIESHFCFRSDDHGVRRGFYATPDGEEEIFSPGYDVYPDGTGVYVTCTGSGRYLFSPASGEIIFEGSRGSLEGGTDLFRVSDLSPLGTGEWSGIFRCRSLGGRLEEGWSLPVTLRVTATRQPWRGLVSSQLREEMIQADVRITGVEIPGNDWAGELLLRLSDGTRLTLEQLWSPDDRLVEAVREWLRRCDAPSYTSKIRRALARRVQRWIRGEEPIPEPPELPAPTESII